MLDFWESMGRIVADEESLRQTLLDDAELKKPNTAVICKPSAGMDHRESWTIPSGKYEHLHLILVKHLKYAPVSSFCLGEWLRVLPFLTLRDFSAMTAAVAVKAIDLKHRTPEFYAGLGAITVDDTFAGEVAADPKAAFPRATLERDLKDLQILAQDSFGYCDHALSFCASNWEPPCFVIVRPYSSADAQTQPSLETAVKSTTKRRQKP